MNKLKFSSNKMYNVKFMLKKNSKSSIDTIVTNNNKCYKHFFDGFDSVLSFFFEWYISFSLFHRLRKKKNIKK